MAGRGSRFSAQGYTLPKPFIDVAGRMMIDRVLEGVSVLGAAIILVIQKDFISAHGDRLEFLREKYDVSSIAVEQITQGACCTAMVAHRYIDGDDPVLFVDSDNLFPSRVIRAFIADAVKRDLTGSLLTFPANDPAFSYVKLGEDGYAHETREKTVISNHGICGAYYFSRGADFVDASVRMMIYGDRQKNEYYMSNVYNYLIRDGSKVGIFEILQEDFMCLGTPEQLRRYLENHRIDG